MKINKHNIILFLAILIFVANCVVYFYAPEQVPIHWNYAGDIDQYAPKYVLFGLGLLPLAFFYLIPFFKKIDPHSKTIEQRGKKNISVDTRSCCIIACFIKCCYDHCYS